MKKEEKGMQAIQEELELLKRQVAGLKGHNNSLKKRHEEVNKEAERLKDALGVEMEAKGNIIEELRRTKARLEDYEAIVEWYDELPWYRKVFVGRFFPKKKG